jgi:hypothetical protein
MVTSWGDLPRFAKRGEMKWFAATLNGGLLKIDFNREKTRKDAKKHRFFRVLSRF